jgi:hypothetical protein
MGLTVVDREYLKLLRPELATAIRNGEPDRAASLARAIAKLRRKTIRAAVICDYPTQSGKD